MNKAIRLVGYSIAAIVAPLLLCAFFIHLTRGTAFSWKPANLAYWLLMLYSGLPFVALMPLSGRVRVFLGLVLLPLTWLLLVLFGFWYACFRFHSCV
jgi:hypothetical protein